VAPGFVALCAAAPQAQALVIPGAPVLGPATVNGYVAISLADYAQVLNAPGVKQLGPMFIPGGDGVATAACTAAGFCNYGTGTISATLGVDPTILLSATPANNGGGESSLFMSYQVEHYVPGALPGTTFAATVLTADQIDQTGLSAAQAILTISGINGTIYTGYNCSAAAGAAFGCSTALPNLPFADQAVTLVDNTVYDVDMTVDIYAHDPVSAQIDPMFFAPSDPNGEFIFSPGVTSAVPEPAVWSMMLTGFGGLGAATRMSRRRPGGAAA